jgi:hypothetical protein
MRRLLLGALVTLGCTAANNAAPAPDMTGLPDMTQVRDLTPAPLDFTVIAGDLSGTLPDLAPAADLARPPTPPAAVWLASAGGSFLRPSLNVGPNTKGQVNFSVGGQWVYGAVSAPSGAVLSAGYFSDDIY